MNESLFVGDVKAGKLLEISEIDDVLQSYGKEIERQGVAGYEFTGEKGKKIYRRMRAVRGTPFSVYSSKTISGPLDPTPVDPKLNQKDSSVKGGDVESADRFDEPSVDKKVWREIVARQGQYRFRNALRDAYGNRCCISDSSIVELLEAAHIDPHSDAEDYSTNNGLLLRADFHTLFDRLLFALDDDQVIHISKRLMDSEYKQYHGKRINSPKLPATPSRLALGRRYKAFLQREHERLLVT